jgi:hypothetical protein
MLFMYHGNSEGAMRTDDELIDQVESFTIDPRAFDHEAHVRLAYAYLKGYDVFDALLRCRRALRGLAEHHGAARKYHETVTCGLVFLIHERMAGGEGAHDALDWEDFARANPDLLQWRDGAFFDYYPPEVLHSDLARRTFVLPHAPTAGASSAGSARVGEPTRGPVAPGGPS